MMTSESYRSWSTDSQTHTQICILESQIGVKDNTINDLKEKNNLLELKQMELKDEVDRLNDLVRTLTVGGTDILDRFK